MLKSLYDWTMRLAERPSAEIWLFVIAFIESSIFLVPAEVLFLPMAIANPKKVWRYGLIASLGSILGGSRRLDDRLFRLRDDRGAGAGILRQARRIRGNEEWRSTSISSCCS